MADEGFHEIQLSGKHLVALFMAATVVAVVIFLCGVMVGRDVQAQRIAMTAAAAAEAPADPTAEARPQRVPEPQPATPPTSAPPAAPASQETLSYPDRLASSTPPAEALKEQPREPPSRAVETRRASPPPKSEPPARSASTAPNARSAPSARAEPVGAGFSVQVAAVRERGEADTIARRLSTKGYPAYVMSPPNGAPRVFRVRVGKYKERREAEQVANRLEREEQFKPWITR